MLKRWWQAVKIKMAVFLSNGHQLPKRHFKKPRVPLCPALSL